MIDVKLNFPGLLPPEKMASGNLRYRVRVEGDKKKRITLTVPPEHPEFHEHYHAARRGIQLKPTQTPVQKSIRGSMAWLCYLHLESLEKKVAAGNASPLTLKKRRGLFKRVIEECGDYRLEMPTHEVVKLRDKFQHTPALADDIVDALSAMYKEAIPHICTVNPAAGVGRIYRGKGGAVPWTVQDLRKYRETHEKGSQAHLCLTLFTFTACRISDAVTLGRGNEFEKDGILGLGWQPRKKGSAPVEIPLMPPLFEATRAAKVQGATYLLTKHGKPYASPDALGQHFRRWCREAGLENRSSHGIRKAAAHLLAQEGCTQYQIMTIHGHTSAKTSEVYTKGVERWKLAKDAMSKLEAMDW
ncbi:site-specific integrase [Maritalea myrionectae]|uniref:site-specific integrase n=1 Tax=Maritalea myrionectae TaxID=454601 RepID=UPI001967D7EB|nr:tyrosine-type recombinase/integrase [Maritalea myrionectae]